MSDTSQGERKIGVVAQARAKSGREDDVRKALTAAATAAPSEAGCISYRLYEETHEPGSFFTVEEWESEDALQAHLARVKGALDAAKPLLQGDIRISALAQLV